MVANASLIFALAGACYALEANAVGVNAKANQADANDLKPREVTVTVTECPADSYVPMAPYTTADLPPVELTPTTTPVAYTSSIVTPGGETSATGGATPEATSSYTPIVPIPVTSTTPGTTEPASSPSTSVYTATTTGSGTGTGTGNGVVSSSVMTHVTSAVTSHSVTGTSVTSAPSPTPTSTVGAASLVSANFGLMVLVAMAAMA